MSLMTMVEEGGSSRRVQYTITFQSKTGERHVVTVSPSARGERLRRPLPLLQQAVTDAAASGTCPLQQASDE